MICTCTLNIYLDKSSVLVFVKTLKHALFPVTSQCAWRSLGAWRALASRSAGVSFGSLWAHFARYPLRALASLIASVTFSSSWARWTRGSLRSLGARRAFCSRFPCVASVSTLSRGSLRAGWTGNACLSWGTRVPRHTLVLRYTWNPWRAKAGTITTARSMRWKLPCPLYVTTKQRVSFQDLLKMLT